MLMFADALSDGIIKQNPKKFVMSSAEPTLPASPTHAAGTH